MMVSTRGSVLRLLAWQWKHVLLITGAATAVVILHNAHSDEPSLPAIPLGVLGGALGIFVSFRTNQAYNRWWEGRQLWGRIVNLSRHVGSQLFAYVHDEATAKALVGRQIAYVHALRSALRDQDAWADVAMLKRVPEEERAALKPERNLPAALLDTQLRALAKLVDAGTLDARRMQSLDQTLLALLDAQGGCERIKRTPMPRGYGFISERLLAAFAIAFPFGLVKDLGWWTIPVSLIVCLGFALISEAGRVLEDPFTLFWNALPLAAITTTIEINLGQRLGEDPLPDNPTPDKNGILM